LLLIGVLDTTFAATVKVDGRKLLVDGKEFVGNLWDMRPLPLVWMQQ